MAGIITMSTEMDDMTGDIGRRDWLRLMTWLSPAFPVGGFTYSSGLEAAVRGGAVTKAEHLQEWLSAGLVQGTLWNDAVLLCAAMDADHDMSAVDELAVALAGAPGRYLETTAQGKAFGEAVKRWSGAEGQAAAVALPVVIGRAAASLEIDAAAAAAAFLGAAVANQLQAAIRLGVLGQDAAVGVQHALEELVLRTARRAAESGFDGLGGCTMLAEIATLRHETLDGRLFRS